MPTIVKKKQYAKATPGLHHARLLKFEDLGLVESMGQEKPRGRFIWLILDEEDPEGNAIYVQESFNLTIEEKSRLRKILTQMLGKAPDGEIVLDDLVNTECDLLIQHNESNGKVYADIENHLPHKPNKEEGNIKPAGAGSKTVVDHNRPKEDPDEDIPFNR